MAKYFLLANSLEVLPRPNATISELPDEAAAAAFLAGITESTDLPLNQRGNMSIPMASALGAGGPNIDFTLPPEFQKYSRQVLSRNPSSQYVTGPASIVNPYTGALPASASQAPTQVAAQAPQIVRLPINMEIERNRAAADYYRNPISAIRAELAEAQEREMVEKQLAKAQKKAERQAARQQKDAIKLMREEMRLQREVEEEMLRHEKRSKSRTRRKSRSRRQSSSSEHSRSEENAQARSRKESGSKDREMLRHEKRSKSRTRRKSRSRRQSSSSEHSRSEENAQARSRKESGSKDRHRQSNRRRRRDGQAESAESAGPSVEPLEPSSYRGQYLRPASPIQRPHTTDPSRHSKSHSISEREQQYAASFPPEYGGKIQRPSRPASFEEQLPAVRSADTGKQRHKAGRPHTPYTHERYLDFNPGEGVAVDKQQRPAKSSAPARDRSQMPSQPFTPPLQRSVSPPYSRNTLRPTQAQPFTPPLQRSPSPPTMRHGRHIVSALPSTPPLQRDVSPPGIRKHHSGQNRAQPFTPPLQRSPSPPHPRDLPHSRDPASRALLPQNSRRQRSVSPQRIGKPRSQTVATSAQQEAHDRPEHDAVVERRAPPAPSHRAPLLKPKPRRARAEIIDVRFKDVTYYLTLAQITRDAPNGFTRALDEKKHKLKIGHLLHIDAKDRNPFIFGIIVDWLDGKDILPLSKSQLVTLTKKTDAPVEAYITLRAEVDYYSLPKLSTKILHYIPRNSGGKSPDIIIEDGPYEPFQLWDMEEIDTVDVSDIEQFIRAAKPGRDPTVGLPPMRMVILDAAINFGGKLRPIREGADMEQLLVYHISIQPSSLTDAFRNLLKWEHGSDEEGLSLTGELTRREAAMVTFDIEHYDDSAVFPERIVGPPYRQKVVRPSTLRELCDGLNPILRNELYPWEPVVLDAVRVRRLQSADDAEEPLPFDYEQELRQATSVYVELGVANVIAEITYPKHRWDAELPIVRLKSIATTTHEIRREQRYQTKAGTPG